MRHLTEKEITGLRRQAELAEHGHDAYALGLARLEEGKSTKPSTTCTRRPAVMLWARVGCWRRWTRPGAWWARRRRWSVR
ncbi:hypothetical protein NKH77_00425 [Streptomyces sp. M19]